MEIRATAPGTRVGLRKQSCDARARVQKEHEKRSLGCLLTCSGVTRPGRAPPCCGCWGAALGRSHTARVWVKGCGWSIYGQFIVSVELARRTVLEFSASRERQHGALNMCGDCKRYP